MFVWGCCSDLHAVDYQVTVLYNYYRPMLASCDENTAVQHVLQLLGLYPLGPYPYIIFFFELMQD